MQLHWHTEPFLLLGILVPLWLYFLAIGPGRSYFTSEPFPLGKAFIFTLGVSLIYLTVGSPLDQIAEQYLFSMHMVQHMLLIYAIPFLLFWGTPTWLIDRILEKFPSLLRYIAPFLNPAIGGFLFTFSYTIWHIPVLYDAAINDKVIHILEHLNMFVTGAMMLWSIASPSELLKPSPHGVKMLYIFVLMIGQLPVFAFLSFSDEVLYVSYEFAPRIWGLSAVQDQILGGVVMKLSNMVVSVSVLTVSFYQWYQKEC